MRRADAGDLAARAASVRAAAWRIVGAMLETPERYLDEIRARDLRIFYRGQRFDNAVDHPVAAPAARWLLAT